FPSIINRSILGLLVISILSSRLLLIYKFSNLVFEDKFMCVILFPYKSKRIRLGFLEKSTLVSKFLPTFIAPKFILVAVDISLNWLSDKSMLTRSIFFERSRLVSWFSLTDTTFKAVLL